MLNEKESMISNTMEWKRNSVYISIPILFNQLRIPRPRPRPIPNGHVVSAQECTRLISLIAGPRLPLARAMSMLVGHKDSGKGMVRETKIAARVWLPDIQGWPRLVEKT